MLRTALLALAATTLSTLPTWAASSPLRAPNGLEVQHEERLQDPETFRHHRLTLAHAKTGLASWYGPGFHGNTTANGERFNQWEPTAAHRSLPFGTRVQVTNLDNGRRVTVRINDRGPYSGGRVIDLSRGSASQLGMLNSGTARVRLQVLR